MDRTVCFCNSNRAWGGGEKWHLEAALGLSGRGCRVFLMAGPGTPLFERASKYPELTVVPRRFSGVDFLNPFTVKECADFFSKEGVSQVILGLPADLKTAGLAAKRAGVPGIWYRRGSALPVKNSLFNRYLYGRVLTGLIVNSKETARLVLEGGSLIDARKVHVLYNGLDADAFEASVKAATPWDCAEDIPVIGNAGRLTAQKGQKFLLHMSRELLDRGVRHKLIIAGDGELREDLGRLATELALGETIVFTGFLEDMAPFWRTVEYFVLSSLWEGFGYVLAEALLAEKPVVAFNGNSMPEIVKNGETGTLIPMPGREEKAESVGKRLAEAIMNQMGTNNEASRMAQNGRAFCRETFGRETGIDTLHSLLWPEAQTGKPA